jgi:hypothetical protein
MDARSNGLGPLSGTISGFIWALLKPLAMFVV